MSEPYLDEKHLLNKLELMTQANERNIREKIEAMKAARELGEAIDSAQEKWPMLADSEEYRMEIKRALAKFKRDFPEPSFKEKVINAIKALDGVAARNEDGI